MHYENKQTSDYFRQYFWIVQFRPSLFAVSSGLWWRRLCLSGSRLPIGFWGWQRTLEWRIYVAMDWSPKLHFRKPQVSSIKIDIMEKPPSWNFFFPLSLFRKAGLQTNGCKWYSPMSPVFQFSQLQGEFMRGGSPGKITTLTAFFP